MRKGSKRKTMVTYNCKTGELATQSIYFPRGNKEELEFEPIKGIRLFGDLFFIGWL